MLALDAEGLRLFNTVSGASRLIPSRHRARRRAARLPPPSRPSRSSRKTAPIAAPRSPAGRAD
ncbi:hypothetical protein LP420_37330 [Massilia sp. B-10]|nr:hypothetical protein LP420_37330 [Massilia sp. B-10]